MQESSLRNKSLLFQWNFFERAISNYSVIVKMFQHMEGESDLLAEMPRVFVEETVFDACELVMRGSGKPSFFSIDGSLRSIDSDDIEKAKGSIFSPTVYHDDFGYGTLYVYPLKRGVHVFAYFVLGKRKSITLDESTTRDLDLLGEILNRFMLLKMRVNELKMEEEKRTKQLDARLAVTKTLLENIIDQFPYSLLLVDRNGNICFANQSAKEEFFEGIGFVAGEPVENVIHGIEKGFLEKDFILKGELHYTKGDDYKLYTLESYPVKDDRGKIVFKSLVLKDVIDERMEEEENVNRSRMESIGKLAGGIAHDFNNVLTGILGYASLMKRMTAEDQQLNRYAEVIENSAKRAAALTEHLLNFSRRQRVRVIDRIDLNALLGDVLFLMRESFRNIMITTEFDPKLPQIKGNAGELQHAVLNLCVNAKDAMPDGGTLRVRTERKAYLGGKEFVVVTIGDTGSGIDEHLKSRVFEPYFTTKTESKKIGMGLHLVQKVIKSHKGFIELESDKEKGTSFALYFPVAEPCKEEPKKPRVEPSKEIKKRGVLVVDDEEVVRGLLTGVLSAEGFEVFQAADGIEAMEVYESHHRSIDLVILDMIMPGMGGEEVLRRLRESSRKVKVVISSGFMSEEQRDKLQEYGVDGFLDKPYGDTDVIDIAHSVLSS
ncbi:MAG: response regulator [Syntrophorhabdales bacterium]|jgi:signal transduction histidine kinase/CheY-like chemotaxis protein